VYEDDNIFGAKLKNNNNETSEEEEEADEVAELCGKRRKSMRMSMKRSKEISCVENDLSREMQETHSWVEIQYR
jgi:hypothetical protein